MNIELKIGKTFISERQERFTEKKNADVRQERLGNMFPIAC